MTSTSQDRKTAILAGAFAAAGAVVLAVLFVVQSDPQPLGVWFVLAAAFFFLQISAVEVNDRLFVSSAMMVAFTAAVVFGRESAVLAVVLMAAVSALHPDDLRERRWRQPAGNFGQLVISAAVGIAVFLPFLPDAPVTGGDLPLLAVGAALAAVVYDWVNFRLVALYVRVAYPDRDLRPWSKMLANHFALSVLGAFGGILGAAYVLVGPLILPLMFLTFVVGHVGFASYSKLREAHEDTIRGFVKAVEALDPYTRGHTERVARFVRMTGEELGLGPERLETLRWAALIHDVGKVAVPASLLHKPGLLTDDEYSQTVRHMQVVEEVLSRVDFLRPMVAIVAGQHALLDEESEAEVPLESRILATADAFDAMTSTRSYRSAVTQATAFDQLRRREDVYGPEVVTALIAAIGAAGEVYGSPDEESAAEVERLVRERAIRA
ncbi:MAG: HD domain-containing phosphohydrolase [Acidimicrobiia bacterium]